MGTPSQYVDLIWILISMARCENKTKHIYETVENVIIDVIIKEMKNLLSISFRCDMVLWLSFFF